jgi:hypothetical protein
VSGRGGKRIVEGERRVASGGSVVLTAKDSAAHALRAPGISGGGGWW